MQIKYFFKISFTMIASWLSVFAFAQTKGSAANPFILEPTATTVAWGYYWSEAQPVLRIQSGDFVTIHTLLTSNPERLLEIGRAHV